jgi:hypothetical protein
MKIWCLITLLLLSTAAHGEIYRWRDRTGVTHFASSLDDVPVKYRARVKAMNYGPEPKGEGSAAAGTTAGMSTSVSMPVPQAANASGETGQRVVPGRQLRREARRVPDATREE